MKRFCFPTSPVNMAMIGLCSVFMLALVTDAFAWQRQVARSRNTGQFTKSATVTGAQGNTISREAQRHHDSAAGSWSRSATTTGPDGQTVQSGSSATRTADGYVKTGSISGPQGNTVSREVQGHWDPATGTWTKQATVQRGE